MHTATPHSPLKSWAGGRVWGAGAGLADTVRILNKQNNAGWRDNQRNQQACSNAQLGADRWLGWSPSFHCIWFLFNIAAFMCWMWCFSRHKIITVWLFNSTSCHVSCIYSLPTEDCATLVLGSQDSRTQQHSAAARIAKPQSNMYSEFAARTHIRFLSMCGNDEAPGYDVEFIVLCIPGGLHYQYQGRYIESIYI